MVNTLVVSSSRAIADGFLATSNDAWGPTGGQMSEIAQMTYNG
jgi:hypothetical protein